jgi:hypothetical protein
MCTIYNDQIRVICISLQTFLCGRTSKSSLLGVLNCIINCPNIISNYISLTYICCSKESVRADEWNLIKPFHDRISFEAWFSSGMFKKV